MSFNNGNFGRPISPVIGVILMVAITVILAAIIAWFVFGMSENFLIHTEQQDIKIMKISMRLPEGRFKECGIISDDNREFISEIRSVCDDVQIRLGDTVTLYYTFNQNNEARVTGMLPISTKLCKIGAC